MKQRSAGVLLWAVFGASLAITLVTLIAVRPEAPPLPPGAQGPVYPRMSAPPQNANELLRTLGIGSLVWHASVLSAPLFLLLARLLPFGRRRWPVALLGHAAAVLGLAALTALVQHRLTYAGAPIAPPLGEFVQVALLTNTLPFVTVAALAHALDALTRVRERELEAAHVSTQLVEARLEALSAQLQPHFLFNTLQAISTLIREDADAADRMLTRLGDLLREVLRRGEAREVTLAEELTVLEPYLDISRWRFSSRLTVSVDVDDDAREAFVPFFLLQPLVENAMQHGVGSRAGPATVRIAARRENGRLRIEVADDGPGARGEPRDGLGLRATRARLAQMYGARHTLDIASSGSGFRVSIELPWKTAAA